MTQDTLVSTLVHFALGKGFSHPSFCAGERVGGACPLLAVAGAPPVIHLTTNCESLLEWRSLVHFSSFFCPLSPLAPPHFCACAMTYQEGWKTPLFTFPLHEKNITPTVCQALSFILVTALKERVFVKVGTRYREVEDLLSKRWSRAWDGPLWLWVKRQRLSMSELLFSLFW